MASEEVFVVGLIEENGRIHKDTEDDLELIAETTLQRCSTNDKNLRALDLSSTLFTTRFMTELAACLSHNTALVELYMDRCRLEDEGVRILAHGLAANKSTGLRALSLADNQIKCRGAAFISKAIEARAARWTRTFGGYLAPSMGPGSGLQHLSLKGNEIGAVGAKALSEVLMACDDSLETLNLQGNKIDDWGTGWLAMALRNHGYLRCLNLSGNPIGADGVEELQGAAETAKASLVTLPIGGHHRDVVREHVEAGHRQASIYVSDVPSRPPSAAQSRPGSAARSRPSSAARSRPESAGRSSRPSSAARSQRSSGAFSRPSSAHSASSAASSGYRRPGSASRKVPVTIRRLSRPASASDLRRSGGQETTANLAEAEAVLEEALSTKRDDTDEGAAKPQQSPSSPKQGLLSPKQGGAARIAGLPSPARNKCSELPKRLLRNGKPNPNWPPHPLKLAKARRESAESVPAPLTFTAPTTSSAAAAAARMRPSERGVGANEAESTTVLSSPSRWRWKQRDNGPENGSGESHWSASASGCGTSAARRIRRSNTAPELTKKIGALLGPAAAAAMAAMSGGAVC